jgi:hypothetical protein
MNVLHIVALVLAGFLAWAGARLGGPGTTGSAIGAVVGGLLGLAVGFGLVVGSAEYLLRRLRKMSVEDLRRELRDPAHRTPRLVLAELRRRGEASPDDLEVVIAMLTEESAVRRKRGFLALQSVFPELLKVAPDLGPNADAAQRAQAVAALRQAIETWQRDR